MTEEGKKDVFLKTQEIARLSSTLLKTHFKKSDADGDEKYFLKRTINRIGFYMLYSCIQGFKNTSLHYAEKQNIRILQEWAEGINPSITLFNYIENLVDNFVLFDKYNKNDELQPITKNKNKMEKILHFEKKLAEMYPNEYALFNPKKFEYPKHVQKFIDDSEKITKTFEIWVRNLNNKMKKETREKLRDNECPRCHYDGEGPVKNGPFKGSINFRGYKAHGPDKGDWCDLCDYGIDDLPDQ